MYTPNGALSVGARSCIKDHDRLMLFRETVAVYCENHTEHKYTVGRMQSSVIYTYPVRTTQETHYVSAAKPNRLMLFRETVTVYCEKHMEHTDTLCGQNAEFCNIYKFSDIFSLFIFISTTRTIKFSMYLYSTFFFVF
jgi:hypothetical protein